MKKHLVKWMSAVALVAIVVTLGVSLASAQEQPPAPDRPLRARIGEALAPLRHLAGHVIAATGLTPEEIRAKIAEGMTLAEIAEAAGADMNAIIEWEVSEQAARLNGAVATGRLTRAEADARLAEIRERIVAAMNGELPLEPRRPLGVLGLDIVNVVADATGLTPQQVVVQAREGATLAELIEANGGDVAAIEAAIMAQATEKINAALAGGALTQARADRRLAALPDAISRALEFRPGEPPMGEGK